MVLTALNMSVQGRRAANLNSIIGGSSQISSLAEWVSVGMSPVLAPDTRLLAADAKRSMDHHTR